MQRLFTMDEISYAEALDSICFLKDNREAHYFDTNQEREGKHGNFLSAVFFPLLSAFMIRILLRVYFFDD